VLRAAMVRLRNRSKQKVQLWNSKAANLQWKLSTVPVLVTGLQTTARWRPLLVAQVKKMARVLSSVHAISKTCSLCWTSLCAACLYIIARPDSQFLCTRVYGFLWPEVQSHSDDSHMHVTVPCSTRVSYSLRLAPQCRAFSSIIQTLGT